MYKIGDVINETFIVDLRIYQGFITLFSDKNPMHTNREFAQKHGFKEEVMHGNILNGFISYFIGEKLPEKEVVIVSQGIKYKQPVYLNDKLSFEAKVVDVHEVFGLVDFKFVFINQDGKKVAQGEIAIKRIA